MADDLTLEERVRARVRFSVQKHEAQAYEMTEDMIDTRVEEVINGWSNLELLAAISLELEEKDAGR